MSRKVCTMNLRSLSLLLMAATTTAQAGETNVTFSQNVAPIFMDNCVQCHRPGQIAPMSLMTFDEARPWAKSIHKEVSSRRMPPWHAAPDVQEYINDRSLTETQIATITQWVDQGARRGDPSDLPPVPAFNDDWLFGEPDLVLAMEAPYEISAVAEDEYRCFCLDPGLTEDRWVDVVEVLPGNRTIDHHIVLYVDQGGKIAPAKDAAQPGPGYTCFGGAGFNAYMIPGGGPGYTPRRTPEGSGYLLRAGSKIVMQMHYHSSGKPEVDLTRVGLHFAKKPANKVLYNGYVFAGLRIPPGDPNYVVNGRRSLSEDITVHALVAHMHYLGKSMDMWAVLPDGDRVDLYKVPRFDFNWQTEYALAEPIRLPKGTVMHMKAVFDNSAESPYQHSDPPRTVTLGEATTDEMAVAVFYHTRDAENIVDGIER